MSDTSTLNSCKMIGRWDYANPNTGKQTEGKEIYRFNSLMLDNVGDSEADYGYTVIETKNKVRGSGKALSLRFESSEGKDFELLGWSLDITGVQQ